jgi:hypothetical protein
VLEEEGAHGLEDLGEERRGGVGVHVDSAHLFILLQRIRQWLRGRIHIQPWLKAGFMLENGQRLAAQSGAAGSFDKLSAGSSTAFGAKCRAKLRSG